MTAPWQGAAARKAGGRPNVRAIPAIAAGLVAGLALLLAVTGPARAEDLPAAGRPGVEDVRLLEGWQQRDGSRMAAIEIRLKPGWHTYWRIPGEAGIAPEVDWSGSRNLASVAYRWPRPEVFEQFGLTSFGHSGRLVLPVVLTATDPAQPIEARARIDFGACNEICTPAAVEVSARLVPGAPPAGRAVIAAALATAPLGAAAAGITGTACRLVPEAAGPVLRTDVTFDADVRPFGHAIFESAGRPVGLGAGSVQGRTVRAEARLRPGATIDRSTLRLTLVGDGQAVEVVGCAG